MQNKADLERILSRIDGRGYKAYRDIEGAYGFDHFDLYIDHVQGDPFAAPSKVRVRMEPRTAGLPEELFALMANHPRRVALEDFLARQVDRALHETVRGRRGTGKSGLISIDAGGQEVLERTAVLITPDWIEARLEAGLPAAGRRVLARQASGMLCEELPRAVEQGLPWHNVDRAEGRLFLECVENQEYIRAKLDDLGLVAFVADGAILPRATGATQRPLPPQDAVPFQSPESLRVTIAVPNEIKGAREIAGMGIPKGVTLITGGGYHGKSTLLRAIERAVYPHIPGDGREYVVTTRDAVKIRAEDGRRVEQVDIHPFIADLPYGRSTTAFSSDDASGSTSQAANIVEAIEAGATTLLLDEDTSATNFMVRDARMQALVHKEHEPITPFLDRVRELHDTLGVSTVLVMGGCGDYFDVADTVILMRGYVPHDATDKAKAIAREFATRRKRETVQPMTSSHPRIPMPESFDPSHGRRDVRIDARGVEEIRFGTETIDLRHVEQLADASQTRAVGHAIHLAAEEFMGGRTALREVVDAIERFFDENGLDGLDPFRRGERHPGNFARPRKYEVAAAINRLRTVRMEQG